MVINMGPTALCWQAEGIYNRPAVTHGPVSCDGLKQPLGVVIMKAKERPKDVTET